jgi:hypothetical protein
MRYVVPTVDFIGLNFHPYYARIDHCFVLQAPATGSHDRVHGKWKKRVSITEFGLPAYGLLSLESKPPTTLARPQAVETTFWLHLNAKISFRETACSSLNAASRIFAVVVAPPSFLDTPPIRLWVCINATPTITS